MRKSFSCSDGFCGADDCKTCHPMLVITFLPEEDDEDEEELVFQYEPRDRDE